MSEFDFSGKTALVVGGSSGIGNAIAQAFRKRGAEVAVWGTRESADAYADEPGSDLNGLLYSCIDVSDPAQIDAFDPGFDELDVLVLSQGIVRYKQEEFEREGWESVIDVNLNSVMNCARHFRSMLKKASGSLIIISSIAAFRSMIGNPAYAASKAGAAHLCRTLGQAWARDGIRVNGVAPGFVETKLTKITTENKKRNDATIATIPLQRIGQPSDIEGAALFLASPLASYIIGQTIIVDGGLTL
jgi:3-oxoacyl-[acyl-carrier protein] reductase